MPLTTSFEHFINSSSNNADLREETDEKFVFSEGSVKIGQDNVITIVQVFRDSLLAEYRTDTLQLKDNMGLNETGCAFYG